MESVRHHHIDHRSLVVGSLLPSSPKTEPSNQSTNQSSLPPTIIHLFVGGHEVGMERLDALHHSRQLLLRRQEGCAEMPRPVLLPEATPYHKTIDTKNYGEMQ